MENQKEYINQMTIKLEVLRNRIEKLQAITEEVIGSLNLTYQREIKELILKEEEAKQILLKIQKVGKKK